MLELILCVVILVQSIIHHFERRDLYNRIMSKDLAEYKGESREHIPSAHEKLLNNWRSKGGEDK